MYSQERALTLTQTRSTVLPSTQSCTFIPPCLIVSIKAVFKLSWLRECSYVKNQSGILWEPYVNKTLWLALKFYKTPGLVSWDINDRL